jgi:mono/diheme cytochrome c family protein
MRMQSPVRIFSNILRNFALLLLAAALLNVASAQNAPAVRKPASPSNENQGAEARGKYIVENIAICAQCHTPRDARGNPDRSRWLGGAAVWLQSAEPTENWPLQAPRIAGALPGTDAEMITLLTTGIWNGGYLRPPMPQFRMTQQDAAAVVAYLKAVKPSAK